MLQELVQSICSITFEQAPEHTRQRAALCVLDGIGVGLAGASHPLVARIERAIISLGGAGDSTVFAGRPRQSLLDAALLNGTAMQVHDFNDVHLSSRTHPSVAILPAVFAMAEARKSSGREALTAYLAGYEVVTAIGAGLLPEHYSRGWHPTSTIGVFGAAAAVSKLLRLSPEATSHALNLAGTQSGGVRAAFGGMVKHMHPGKAAMNGLLAAVWAEAGITSGSDTLADRFGFAMATTGRTPHLPQNADGEWAIDKVTFKRYPCCLEGHPSVELARRLRSVGLTPDKLVSLTIRLHPDVVSLVGQPEPETGTAAKFSLPHCVALAFTHGAVATSHFDQDPREPGATTDVRRRIRLISDGDVAYSEALGEAVDLRGRITRERICHTGGSLVEPFTPEDVSKKFLAIAAPVLGSRRSADLMDLVLRLESLPNLSLLLAATQPVMTP